MNFFGVQIIMERLFNLFSFDASDNYGDANRWKTVHGAAFNLPL